MGHVGVTGAVCEEVAHVGALPPAAGQTGLAVVIRTLGSQVGQPQLEPDTALSAVSVVGPVVEITVEIELGSDQVWKSKEIQDTMFLSQILVGMLIF